MHEEPRKGSYCWTRKFHSQEAGPEKMIENLSKEGHRKIRTVALSITAKKKEKTRETINTSSSRRMVNRIMFPSLSGVLGNY